MQYVTYEAFGAKGDGVHDDMEAIVAAHAYANEHDLPVRTRADAHYYMGPGAHTAIIETDTDWGNARFTIDDRAVENNRVPVFRVVSRLAKLDLAIDSLMRGQKNAGVQPGVDCYVVIGSKEAKRYIRWGANQNDGGWQTDNFELKADGTIAHELVWDFHRIDWVEAYPIDPRPLTLRGGFFTTIANEEPSTYNYYARNLEIRRSRVTVMNLHHTVTGEGEHGAPYNGFLNINGCAHTLVTNCFFTAHKIYNTIGAAGVPVGMGSYDVTFGSATDITFRDCVQPDILDRSLWGLLGSNFCKNITLDGCIFSRMDAHCGVYNCTIRGCTLGHQGLNAIGNGTLTIENCELFGSALINFRADYGSHWDGDVVIRDCLWHPAGGRPERHAAMFYARNPENHDFGYPCSMPHTITLENVTVDDTTMGADYEGFWFWSNYNTRVTPETKDSYRGEFPYQPCQKLIIRGLHVLSGKPFQVCDNPLLAPFDEIVEESAAL